MRRAFLFVAFLVMASGSVQAKSLDCSTNWIITPDGNVAIDVPGRGGKMTLTEADYQNNGVVALDHSEPNGWTTSIQLPAGTNASGFPFLSKIVFSSPAGIVFSVFHDSATDLVSVNGTVSGGIKFMAAGSGGAQAGLTVNDKSSSLNCTVRP